MSARATRQDGFTLIELLVAMVILSAGILAVMGSFVAIRHLANDSETRDVQAQVGEQELQSITSLGYTNIGLSAAPAHSSDPNNPNFYVQATSPPTFQYNRSNTAQSEVLCTSSTGCTGLLSPGPTNVSSGGKSLSIYRYVTWVDDQCDPSRSPNPCSTTTDYKRVTVVLTQSSGPEPKTPLLFSTIVDDPGTAPGPRPPS